MTSPSESTPRLNLPLIQPAQASKHITHNEAVLDLDSLLFLDLAALNVTSPPNEDQGTCVSIGIGSDDFAGHDGQIACRVDGAWRFYNPKTGMTSRLQSDGSFRLYDGTEWVQADGADPDTLPQLGINSAADTINRLTVKSEAVLFAADDQMADPTGDIRLNLNRESNTDTASIGFQTAYASTAEFGLSGDGNFRIKTADTSGNFETALIIDPANNHVGLGERAPLYALDIHRNSPGAIERIVITNESDNAGSGTALGVFSGTNHSFSTIQYPNGTTSLVSSGANLLIRAKSAGARIRFYNEANETFAIGTTYADFKIPPRLPSHSVSDLPSASQTGVGSLIFVTDESLGPCPAFSDGQVWKRVRDSITVS